MATGGGAAPMGQFLSTLGIPGMTQGTFTTLEQQIGETWLKELEKDMKIAGAEEKRLAEEDGRFFMGVPAVSVYFDAGWSKRSHKHSYVALSGASIVIGARTKKVIGMAIRNKYCHICNDAQQKGIDPKPHKCYRNHTDSAPQMESDMAVQLWILGEKMHGVRYMTLIGDGDSSVIARLQREIPLWGAYIEKIECCNHVAKNIRSCLETLSKERGRPKGKKKGLTPYYCSKITANIRTSMKMRSKEDDRSAAAKKLRQDILNCPNHVYNDHRNCDPVYCQPKRQMLEKQVNDARASHTEGNQLGLKADEHIDPIYNVVNDQATAWQEVDKDHPVPEADDSDCDIDFEFIYEIKKRLNQYANKAESLVYNYTTNIAECWMSIRVRMEGGKQVFRGGKGSFNHRAAGASCRLNMGPTWSLKLWEKCLNQRANYIFFKHSEKRHNEYYQKAFQNSQAHIQAKRRKRKWQRRMQSKTKAAKLAYGPECEQPVSLSPSEEEAAKDKFLKSIQVTDGEAIKIEEQTKEQSESGLWHRQRHIRLTTSKFGEVMSRKSTTPVAPLVKNILYTTFRGNEATKYGLDSEEETRVKYIEYQHAHGKEVSVEGAGFTIYKRNNCLGASCDGYVFDKDIQENGLVEYKNLHSERKSLIMDIVTNKEVTKKWGSFCLRRKEKTSKDLMLHRGHKYYYQIQGQMNVSERPWCDFVLRTEIDLFVERIYRDEKLWSEQMLPKLTAFYTKALLPELAIPRLTKGGIREPGKWISYVR